MCMSLVSTHPLSVLSPLFSFPFIYNKKSEFQPRWVWHLHSCIVNGNLYRAAVRMVFTCFFHEPEGLRAATAELPTCLTGSKAALTAGSRGWPRLGLSAQSIHTRGSCRRIGRAPATGHRQERAGTAHVCSPVSGDVHRDAARCSLWFPVGRVRATPCPQMSGVFGMRSHVFCLYVQKSTENSRGRHSHCKK